MLLGNKISLPRASKCGVKFARSGRPQGGAQSNPVKIYHQHVGFRNTHGREILGHMLTVLSKMESVELFRPGPKLLRYNFAFCILFLNFVDPLFNAQGHVDPTFFRAGEQAVVHPAQDGREPPGRPLLGRPKLKFHWKAIIILATHFAPMPLKGGST